MELISALTEQLGLPELEAKGLAGGVLGLVKSGLAQQAGPEAAAQLEQQVPEMDAWTAEGDTPPGQPGVGELLGGLLGGGGDGGGGLGGLLGGLSGLGGQAGELAGLAGTLSSLVERFGLDGEQAKVATGLVANFLEERLGGDLLEQAKPLLGLLQGGGGGGLGSLVGGFLK